MAKLVAGFRLAVAALLLAPLLAAAAGLGKLTVTSSLGQPLRAEIEIVALQSGEEDSLTIRLANAEAFRQAGIELSPALIGMQFALDTKGARPVIRVSTSQPVNEPFLDLLVELQWATGRLVREYTFLLDPPEYKAQAPAPVPAPAPSAQAAPQAAPAPAAPAPSAEPRPSAVAAPAAAGAKQQEVKKGDTLGAIARQNLPEGVTLNQMLIALYRANEDAFIKGNINLVRSGRILNIPDRDAVAAIAAEEANKQVQANASEFAEYRRQLGGAVAAAPATPVKEREATGRIAPKPEAPAPSEPKDQLKLSKAGKSKAGAPEAKAAREDDRVARERALKESESRVKDLEKNVADLQKLLEMKNQQLAELEKKATAKPAPAPAPVPAPAAKAPEAPKEAPKAPEPPKAAEAPKEAAKEAPKEAPKEAAKEAPKEAPREAAKEAPKEAPKAAAKAPAKEAKDAKKKAAPAATKAPEPSLVDEALAFLTDPVSGGGLAVVLLLLVAYGVWAWRKKKRSHQTAFQDSVLGAAAGSAGTSVMTATPQPAAAAAAPAAAPVQDVSTASVSGASVGAAESDDVDPIAEADVYMAYGRDAQAEEILKEALAKDANRVGVHAKLLEIYANRKDAKAFEQTAIKVKSLTNGAGPEWEKTMALGHSIDPENGLYGAGGAAPAAAPAAPAGAAPTLDFDIGGGGGEAAPAAPKADGGLDFDLGASAPAAGDFAAGGTLKLDAAETQAAAGGLDFDLGSGAKEDDGEKTVMMPRAKAPAAAPAKDPDATVSMDFDLNLDLGAAKPAAEPAKAADAPLDLGGLSLDLGGTPAAAAGGSADPKWQEVATKLDLAKAYQEMGDKDGARELLNEVMKEGDAAQQGQAQQMLSALG
ncbi:MAG TPA: FimV/HubP family polar landmark protein [Burkholderiales bacterium]|nr:FimV/HubP family polar landmark protein [Burkholderiales bacterium]